MQTTYPKQTFQADNVYDIFEKANILSVRKGHFSHINKECSGTFVRYPVSKKNTTAQNIYICSKNNVDGSCRGLVTDCIDDYTILDSFYLILQMQFLLCLIRISSCTDVDINYMTTFKCISSILSHLLASLFQTCVRCIQVYCMNMIFFAGVHGMWDQQIDKDTDDKTYTKSFGCTICRLKFKFRLYLESFSNDLYLFNNFKQQANMAVKLLQMQIEQLRTYCITK